MSGRAFWGSGTRLQLRMLSNLDATSAGQSNADSGNEIACYQAIVFI